MKILDNLFSNYINYSDHKEMHPGLKELITTLPNKIEEFPNLILYGPSGIGKYTASLQIIKRFSKSNLGYEKYMYINSNKSNYFLSISDTHYEVDMSLLGCNSKQLWFDIFVHITDVISQSKDRNGIILCKNFKLIHNELLDNFYSFMQTNFSQRIVIRFILLTTDIGFIPDNILNCCLVIPIARPNYSTYKKINKNIDKIKKCNLEVNQISNIKSLSLSPDNMNISVPYKILSNKIINSILNYKEIDFIQFRDMLYELLIYDISIPDAIWYILETLVNKKILTKEKIINVSKKTFEFFKYYNNNYRPIFHLEKYFYYLIFTIYDLPVMIDTTNISN
jgi:DNA polymerase III delta prime subunit